MLNWEFLLPLIFFNYLCFICLHSDISAVQFILTYRYGLLFNWCVCRSGFQQ